MFYRLAQIAGALSRASAVKIFRLLDVDSYLARNSDVPRGFIRPYYHFARSGAAAGRPGIRTHNRQWLLRFHPIQIFFGPAIVRHLFSGESIEINQLVFANAEFDHQISKTNDDLITVIVPIYGNFDVVNRCLTSIKAAATNVNFQVLVIDDASPDLNDRIRLSELCKSFEFIFHQNDQNLGFVQSVNLGFNLCNSDVVILNSDTVVFDYWLDGFNRLRNQEIGTITAISNNATIYSITPNIELPESAVIEFARDAARVLREFSPDAWEIPTAHGFCMFISRNTLNDIGGFNYEVFGAGYGEENDFSLRASDAGYKNILDPSTYVFHQGSASFGSSVTERQSAAHIALLKLWPNYTKLVQAYLKSNPIPVLTAKVRIELMLQSKTPTNLHFGHYYAGGVDTAIKGEIERDLNEGIPALVIRPVAGSDNISLEIADKWGTFRIPSSIRCTIDEISAMVKRFSLDEVIVHHQIGFESLQEILKSINKDYVFRLHDFYSICPFINLASIDSIYCGQPDEAGCNSCIATRRPYLLDIQSWRIKQSQILFDSKTITAPSMDCRDRIHTVFPNFEIQLKPNNPVTITEPLALNPNPNVIGVLGVLSPSKGLAFLQDILDVLPIGFVVQVIGFIPESSLTVKLRSHIRSGKLRVYGQYSDENEAVRLLGSLNVSKIFFPGLVPETYSYTLDLAMKSNLPIIACNVGAIPERLTSYEKSFIFDLGSTAQEVLQLLVDSNELRT